MRKDYLIKIFVGRPAKQMRAFLFTLQTTPNF